MIKRGERCPVCGQYYDRHLVVDGLIEKDGKILLIRRGIEPSRGKLAFPGGYVDWDETTEEAVVREVLEETGIEVRVNKLLGVFSRPKRDFSQNIALSYSLSVVDDSNIKPQKDEIIEILWLDPNDIFEKLAFDHQEMLEIYLKNK